MAPTADLTGWQPAYSNKRLRESGFADDASRQAPQHLCMQICGGEL
jgi:hypothetical protein